MQQSGNNLIPIGFTEDHYAKNPFGIPSGVHTVGIVFSAKVDEIHNVRLDGQSYAWRLSRTLPKKLKINRFNDLIFNDSLFSKTHDDNLNYSRPQIEGAKLV